MSEPVTPVVLCGAPPHTPARSLAGTPTPRAAPSHLDVAGRRYEALLVALAYTAAGLGVYGLTLNMYLVNDDFDFVAIVAPASSVLVSFEPLLGRFVRPLVVAMYYVSFHIGGLSPWTYHLFTLFPHVLTAWFLYLAAVRIAPDERLWAFLAGLLFLVFGGHSEAVAWPAAVADPLLAAALMAAFVCYLRAVEPGSSRRWLLACFAAVGVASLAKETWVIFPGLVVAHALAIGLSGAEARRRAAIALGGTVACALGYVMMRRMLFGSVTGGYAALSSGFADGTWGRQMRAFLLRCFLPAGSYTANLWLTGRDVLLWPAGFVLLALTARRRPLRILVFSALATLVALLPVLPLTISVSTTESERYVYLATVFSCLFAVWSIKTIFRIRALAIAVCVVVVAGHAIVLVRNTIRWRAAGTLTRSIVDSFADEVVRHDPDGRAAVYILNLADNVGGAYVLRTGFLPAFQFGRPEIADRVKATVRVAAIYMRSADDVARVVRTGPRAFSVDFGANTIVQRAIPSTFHFRISGQTTTSYNIEFSEVVSRAIVLYLSGGRLQFAGSVEGDGAPFGAVDIPSDAVLCEGESLRFAGWALGSEGIDGVTLAADAGSPIGEAIQRPGMRPDVAALYAAFPNVDRAGWDFEVPCSVVRQRAGGTLRVRVSARDRRGLVRVIGERTVSAR